MKNKLLKYMFVALLSTVPPIRLIWNGAENLLVIYEDDYQELTEEDKKWLEAYYAPAKVAVKKRPWSFNEPPWSE